MNQNPYNFNQQNNINQPNNIKQQGNYNLHGDYYQNVNPHIEQSNELEEKTNVIPNLSNDNNNKFFNNKNLIKIIAIFIVIIIVSVIIFMLKKEDKNLSGNNGYTIEQNETLEVYELKGLYDFDMQVLSVEKNFQINYLTSKMNSLAINVRITNTGNEDLEIALLKFELLDNSNNKISNFDIFSSSFILEQPNMFKFNTTLPKNETMSGYLFFYSNDEEINKKINSNNFKKLAISVPNYVSKNNDDLEIDYEEYFINLK